MLMPELEDARGHYRKAFVFFTRLKDPDYENTVKEALQALESAAKGLTPGKKDFDKLLLDLQGTSENEIPPAIVSALRSMYGFRGAAKGVAHGGANGGVVDRHVAELVLSVVGAAVIYLASRGQPDDNSAPF